jgi:hypothetical protein
MKTQFLCLLFIFQMTLFAQKNPFVFKPDLTIVGVSNIRLDANQSRIYFDIEIINKGTRPAELLGIKIQATLSESPYDQVLGVGTGGEKIKTKTSLLLAVNESKILKDWWVSYLDFPLNQYKSIILNLDALDILNEISENNNYFYFTHGL